MKKIYLYVLISVLSCNLFSQSLPSYVPTNGLVGWWPFNGNANDESGNGNNGTVNGALLSNDRNGIVNRCYSFGQNKKIDLGTLATLSNNPLNMTYSFWFFLDSLPISNNYVYPILTKRHIDNYGFDWCTPRVDQEKKLKFFKDDDGYIGPECKSLTLTVENWYYFTCVKRKDSLFLYQNSVLIDSKFDSHILSGSPQNMIIGWHGAWNLYFKGKIDDIGIWNRALTQAEITALYTSNGVGIQDQSLNQISIYPNPAKTQITITSKSELTGKAIKVYDALGKVVYENVIKPNQLTLNIAAWANGIYTIAIPEQGLTYKFVKE
jgi:hypothetical protein